MSFLLITLFISLLNFSKNLPSYLLFLNAFLNSCMNPSIDLFPYSTFFNSTIFIILLSSLPNSFFKFAKNSSTITYLSALISKSSKMFPFQISANLPYTYDNIHWICSSTTAFLILILYMLSKTLKSCLSLIKHL